MKPYGTLDELNAALSSGACAAADENHRALLEAIQQQIFWFSAELASDSERPSPKQRYISSEEISALEAAIDRAGGLRRTAAQLLFYPAAAKLRAACILPLRWPSD